MNKYCISRTCLLVFVCLSGCNSETSHSTTEHAATQSPKTSPRRSLSIKPDTPVILPETKCADTIDNLMENPTLQLEMDGFYDSLYHVQIFAKTHPVVYLSRPSPISDPELIRVSSSIPNTYRAGRTIKKIIRKYKTDPQYLRRLFLRDGYLFEDRSYVAKALVSILTLEDLFNEETIYIHTNNAIEILSKTDEGYITSGGERARLLLNTRVAASRTELEKPLHLDLSQVKTTTLARRIIPITVSGQKSVVRFIYPNDYETKAVLELDGVITNVACIAAPSEQIHIAKEDARTFWAWNQKISDAAQKMVRERPEFDEPEDEPEGEQEDGKLRLEWKKAYYGWKKVFNHREVEYDIFDRRGNPVPPQVCIDFIFDTWERASGNWFRKKGQRPGRTQGFLDFRQVEGLAKRHTSSVLHYSKNEDAFLESVDFPRRNHVPFNRSIQFAQSVKNVSTHIKEGDLLVIHGLREEDMEEHFHTLLVLKTDPLTGIPTVIADNAGRPRIRSIASAMRSAPRRSLKHRIRIKWGWLKTQQESFKSVNLNDPQDKTVPSIDTRTLVSPENPFL